MALPFSPPRLHLSSSIFRTFLVSAFLLIVISLLLFSPVSRICPSAVSSPLVAPAPTSLRHLLFGIASSSKSWPRRKSYVRLWWRLGFMRGAVFLDSPIAGETDEPGLPTLRVSANTSRFPYTFEGGLRSAIRIARIVKELVEGVVGNDSSDADIRWVVLGDDDTLFFPENLVGTLAKYDWEQWYYVGGQSESVWQNSKHSFSMAYGGGGIAMSYPLAKVLARVLDSCLVRYAHLYGSDDRIFACLAELGVGLTHEPGFHQVDVRGDIFGILSAHPLTPLISLHHLDQIEPIFPGMTRMAAFDHLFRSAHFDPSRILQQTICYDSSKLLTISVSWGYVVQIFEGNQLIVDLLSVPETYTHWKRGLSSLILSYMFNTREFNKDPCKKPDVFFFESVVQHQGRIQSNYTMHDLEICQERKVHTKNLKQITIFSQFLQPRQPLRRECCEVLQTSSATVMEIYIRKCKDDELIAMHQGTG
ncbi:uncharacterized protein LOC122045636 [Zingiber officinale]|uniref:Uncharacterized protein n=1 Tax=Zingiber officinale TaxID=94328 RepID=A0A8J5HSF4_ZINOF|nr:uncharacterized protein LOC122045636 [Zingiber officinale]XP_042461881.1 uncharacterized protein LOC122045636 [Zingiber officinale]XP_042461882.1 uncharacterized protein LOC122045636 [Zingiber officinale]KAG6523969.1 hypothetical protein ZIOFF_013858 [Zingiber officinale]